VHPMRRTAIAELWPDRDGGQQLDEDGMVWPACSLGMLTQEADGRADEVGSWTVGACEVQASRAMYKLHNKEPYNKVQY